jgi:hypothetical protein
MLSLLVFLVCYVQSQPRTSNSCATDPAPGAGVGMWRCCIQMEGAAFSVDECATVCSTFLLSQGVCDALATCCVGPLNCVAWQYGDWRQWQWNCTNATAHVNGCVPPASCSMYNRVNVYPYGACGRNGTGTGVCAMPTAAPLGSKRDAYL